jgi:hypothetical protein
MTTESQERRDLRGLDAIQLEQIDVLDIRGVPPEWQDSDLDKCINQSGCSVRAARTLRYFAYSAPETLAPFFFAFIGAH